MDIEDLYELIPDFICPAGCHQCCRNFGVPSRTAAEQERINQFLQVHGMAAQQAQGTTCPHLTEEGCSIYPVRPLICRLYGTSANYPCIMGVKPLRLLHEDEEAEIFHLYQANFF